MTPPPLPPQKKLSGFAIAAIIVGVIIAVFVSGVGAVALLLNEGSSYVPEWIQYPHATPTTSGPKGVRGSTLDHATLLYQTIDSVEKVAEYYKTEITKRGGHATADPSELERWGVHGIVVKDAKGSLKITIMSEGQQTAVLIHYFLWR